MDSASAGISVGLLPARGGSKRIPRKNIKPFHGQPLIARTVATMLASGVFDRIIVSTDDAEIADVAVAAGAEVPFLRTPDLADDVTGTGAVVRDALARLEADPRHAPGAPEAIGALCLVYPAAVFVTATDLADAHGQLIASGRQYVMSASTYPAPIERALRRDTSGAVSMVDPARLLTPSQQLEPAFHDVGQFYWGRRDAWAAGVPVMRGDTEIFEIPHWRVQDIDTPDDWTRAEILFEIIERIG